MPLWFNEVTVESSTSKRGLISIEVVSSQYLDNQVIKSLLILK